MLRASLKTIFYVLQLTVCFIFIFEKTQPTRFPAPQPLGRLPARSPLARYTAYRQPPYRTKSRSRRRIFSWRRLCFLLS